MKLLVAVSACGVLSGQQPCCDQSPSFAQLSSFHVFQGFTDDQMMLVEQNTVMVEEREREIRQIVQSISDLNEIFRDLAGMVVEQVSKRALVRSRANKLIYFLLTRRRSSLGGVPLAPGHRPRQNRLQCGASLCQDGGRFAAITKGKCKKKKQSQPRCY